MLLSISYFYVAIEVLIIVLSPMKTGDKLKIGDKFGDNSDTRR
jgi:hypothetical protein